jgi:peptidoglycan-associated lipoprotein
LEIPAKEAKVPAGILKHEWYFQKILSEYWVCCQKRDLIQMRISKQILVIASMLFIFTASGCSKNLFNFGNGESIPLEEEAGIGPWDPKTQNGGSASSSLYEKPGSGQDFGTAGQGIPGGGAKSSLSTEPFGGNNGESVAAGLDGGASSGLYEKPGPGPDFGSAPRGMPGDGATGSFSAEPFGGNNGESVAAGLDGGASSGLYEKPGQGPDFGSAPKGMPGNGASGSFSAKSFDGDREGNGSLSKGDTAEAPKPDPGFFREENVGEYDTARLYEKPGPGPDFGSAPEGMPGDGATGSFSAEPYVGEDSGPTPEPAEPFLPGKGDNMAVALPIDEETRRQLPYQASDSLEDIHFAFDRYDLDTKSRAVLQKNVAYLESHPNARIEIQGHCDERGSNNYNITLGERRARATKAYLVSHGIDEHRIHTISYGEERPFCFENNEKCWYQNRRGHFLVAE